MIQPQKIKDYSILDVNINAETFFEKRMEYSGDNLIYIGYAKTPNASTADEIWFIVKLTYSGANPTRYQLPDDGAQFKYAWNDRATLFT